MQFINRFLKHVSSQGYFFINVWRKNIFDIYVTEYGTALTTILLLGKGNGKITELRTILQRESQNS
jgi:hypothetical protein